MILSQLNISNNANINANLNILNNVNIKNELLVQNKVIESKKKVNTNNGDIISKDSKFVKVILSGRGETLIDLDKKVVHFGSPKILLQCK